MKKTEIFTIMFIPEAAQYTVLLEELEGTRLIPIWVGISEGNAIAASLQNQIAQRPQTHDLIINLLKLLHVSVERVIVSDLRDNTYFAEIVLRDIQAKELIVDSRPSDAIALAVRVQADIFIDEKVLAVCPYIQKPISEQEVAQFKDELQNIKPEDFFKNLSEENPEEQDRDESDGPDTDDNGNGNN